jgi:hypothetical protein
MNTQPSPAELLIGLYHRNADAAADIAWYADAKRLVRRRAADIGLPWRRYAAVVAATSPMQKWDTKAGDRWPNLDAADRVIRWYRGELDKPGTLGSSARAAAAILDGRQPTQVLGPKTRRFYLALTGRDTDPVLDRWALRAIGWPTESVTESQWAAAAAPYFEAAAELDITPAALQAATWTQIRREWGS